MDIDPAAYYTLGRDDTGKPWRVLERLTAPSFAASVADYAAMLNRAAPRALDVLRSVSGAEALRLLGDFDTLPGDHPSGLGYLSAADFGDDA